MSDIRTQHETEILNAIQAVLPGVRVEALEGEEDIGAQVQNWPAVFVVLTSIDYQGPQVVSYPERQLATWTWTVYCHGRKNPPPPEQTVYQLADAVTQKLAGFRLSDALASPLRILSERLYRLLYESQIREITVSYQRRPA